jgi:hypothetical protein
MINPIDTTLTQQTYKQWWASRRLKYNKGLVIAGLLAFLLYAIVGSLLIKGDFEITLFTIALQGLGYLFMIGVANIFYCLGPLVDGLYNRQNEEGFRQGLFNFGYWFSFVLPFSIPLLIVIIYS